MWRLFLSEIKYAKNVIVGFYLFALPFFIWDAFQARAFRPSLQVMIFCVAVCCSILGSYEAKNKSIRIKRLLPVSFVRSSFLRSILILLFVLIYSGSIYLAEIIRANRLGDDHAVLLIQVSTGLLIFLYGASLLSDLRYTTAGRFFQKAHPILLPILILSVAMIYILTFNQWEISKNFQAKFYTIEAAHRMVIVALIVFTASIITFFSRKTYVE